MEFNFIKNWMNFEAKILITCGRILVLVLEFCEFILIFFIQIK